MQEASTTQSIGGGNVVTSVTERCNADRSLAGTKGFGESGGEGLGLLLSGNLAGLGGGHRKVGCRDQRA